MTKILNLDEVETELDRAILIKGVSYPMRPMAVKEYIATLKDQERVGKASESEALQMMVDSIGRTFPTMPADIVGTLTFPQLEMITKWISGELEEVTQAGNAPSPTKKVGAKKARK